MLKKILNKKLFSKKIPIEKFNTHVFLNKRHFSKKSSMDKQKKEEEEEQPSLFKAVYGLLGNIQNTVLRMAIEVPKALIKFIFHKGVKFTVDKAFDR
jgi:hypothetical protein